jgi:hypothetical protein
MPNIAEIAIIAYCMALPLPPLLAPLPGMFLRLGITVICLPLNKLSFKRFASLAPSFVSNSTYACLYTVGIIYFISLTLLVNWSFYP